MLCPLETFPCVFKEIGQKVHTGQSEGNVNKCGGYKTSCDILFGNDLEAGLHIFVSAFLNLQNAKEEKSLYQIGKNL